MISQAFAEKIMRLHRKPKLNETGEEQNQKHAHHFSLTSRGLFIKNLPWQAK
jgi:hypothetical protein